MRGFKSLSITPLVVAIGVFIFALIFMLHGRNIPGYPNYANPIIFYPLFILSNSANGSLIIIVFIVVIALILLRWITKQGKVKAFLTIGLFVFALFLISCACIFTIFANISHKQSAKFAGNIYHLGIQFDVADWDFPDMFITLYQCDGMGIFCRWRYRSQSYNFSSFSPTVISEQAAIELAPNGQSLYLKVGTDVIYVEESETVERRNPIELSTYEAITSENISQVQPLHTIVRGSMSNAVWSPDGTVLAVGSAYYKITLSETIGVWLYDFKAQLQSPRLLRLENRGELGLSANRIDFSPDGKRLAVGSGDYTSRILDVTTGIELNSLDGYGDRVEAVIFSHDGSLLASTDYWSRQIMLWNITSESNLPLLQENETFGAASLAFSLDDQFLVAGGRGVTIWDTASGNQIAVIPVGESLVESLAVHPAGDLFAAGTNDGWIGIYDFANNSTPIYIPQQEEFDSVDAIAFSTDGTLLASGSINGKIRLWETETWTLVMTLEGHTNSIQSLTFNPAGTILASTSQDGTLRLWGVPK